MRVVTMTDREPKALGAIRYNEAGRLRESRELSEHVYTTEELN